MNPFKWTLTYKLINLVSSIYYYNVDNNLTSKYLNDHQFTRILEKYLNTTLHRDWIGRFYCVVNPNLNDKGQFDMTRVIIEFDNEDTHNTEYVKTWLMKQLTMVADLFKMHNILSYFNWDLQHVGPETEDNYLFVLSLTSQDELRHNIKSTLIHTCIYAIIGLILLITL